MSSSTAHERKIKYQTTKSIEVWEGWEHLVESKIDALNALLKSVRFEMSALGVGRDVQDVMIPQFMAALNERMEQERGQDKRGVAN